MQVQPTWAWSLLGVAVVSFLLVRFTLQYRDAPGASWLALMHTTIGVYTLAHVASALIVRSRLGLVALDHVQVSLTVVSALLWFVFVLAYTGQISVSRRIEYGAVAVISTLLVTNMLSPVHGLMYDSVVIERGSGVPFANPEPGILYLVEVFGVFALGVVGFTVLFRVLAAENHLVSKQAVALIVGSISPYLAAALDLLDLEPAPAMPLIPFGFLGMSVALTYAATRQDLFEVVPATQRIGRAEAFESLSDGVVITSVDGTILNVNGRGCDLFGEEASELVGRQIGSLHGNDKLPPEEVPEIVDYRGLSLETNHSFIDDSTGNVIGHAVRYSDISEKVRNRQRLGVMNRIFRHNVRNDLNAVQAFISAIEHEQDPHRRSEHVERSAAVLERVIDLTEKARSMERELEGDAEPERVAVPELGLFEQWESSGKETVEAVSIDIPDGTTVVTYRDRLRIALENLVENAVEHNDSADPEIRVTAESRDDGITFEIADNGSGIPQHEIDVVQSGTETQLRHSSGLGLWLVKWAVEDMHGTLDFDTSGTGTRIELFVPSQEQ